MNKNKDVIEVVVGFDINEEEISYIKSDFMKEELGFKDGVGYTAKLLGMAMEKWIRENIGIFCPECNNKIEEKWSFCPNCGWSNSNE